MLVNLVKSVLQRINYTVEGFSDVGEAMGRLKAAPKAFNLIVSDMTMPGMSGFRVIETAYRFLACAKRMQGALPIASSRMQNQIHLPGIFALSGAGRLATSVDPMTPISVSGRFYL